MVILFLRPMLELLVHGKVNQNILEYYDLTKSNYNAITEWIYEIKDYETCMKDMLSLSHKLECLPCYIEDFNNCKEFSLTVKKAFKDITLRDILWVDVINASDNEDTISYYQGVATSRVLLGHLSSYMAAYLVPNHLTSAKLTNINLLSSLQKSITREDVKSNKPVRFYNKYIIDFIQDAHECTMTNLIEFYNKDLLVTDEEPSKVLKVGGRYKIISSNEQLISIIQDNVFKNGEQGFNNIEIVATFDKPLCYGKWSFNDRAFNIQSKDKLLRVIKQFEDKNMKAKFIKIGE